MTVQKVFEKPEESSISLYKELLAYEYLYSRKGESFEEITTETVQSHKLPSEVSVVDVAVDFMDEYDDVFKELAK